jgi:phenylpropionate dioxygenase-like ring-hydroxylating dioxygenase large terminal subunit
MQGAVLNDEFFESLESSIVEVNSAQALPPLCYTNREFFEFEKEALFCHEWLCVGRVSWIPKPGDYFTTSHVGEPLVVLRNREGVIKTLSTVCRHRAMFVVEGHGNARGFTCPYHHWSYSLDGKLRGAPAMDRACNFSKEQIRLPEFKLETWLGFIFINFDLDAPPLAPRLEMVTKALANYGVPSAEGLMATESPKTTTTDITPTVSTTDRYTISARVRWQSFPICRQTPPDIFGSTERSTSTQASIQR